MKKVVVKGHEFNIEVILKRSNKRIYMRVKNGYLQFTTPVRLTDERITEIISDNLIMILKNINPTEKNDEYITYLGQRYNLILKKSSNKKNNSSKFNYFIYISCTAKNLTHNFKPAF